MHLSLKTYYTENVFIRLLKDRHSSEVRCWCFLQRKFKSGLTQPYVQHPQDRNVIVLPWITLKQRQTVAFSAVRQWASVVWTAGSCREWVKANATTQTQAASSLWPWITVDMKQPFPDICWYQWLRNKRMSKPAQLVTTLKLVASHS